MADRRRRRPNADCNEVLSEGESQQHNSLSLTQSVNNFNDEDFDDLSEYESAEEDELSNHSDTEDERVKDKENFKEVQEEEEKEVDENDEEVHDDEGVTREQGDGQEQSDDGDPKLKKLNKKENEDLPTFIPIKGQFFQHDVRNDGNSRGGSTYRSPRESNKSRWLHDKFDEFEQTSKCKAQLIAEYGYDIRAYDYNSAPNYARDHRHGGKRRSGNRREITGPKGDYRQHPHWEQTEKRSDDSATNSLEQEWPNLDQQSSKMNKSKPIKSQNFHSSKPNRGEGDTKESIRQNLSERRAADIEESYKKQNKQNENKIKAIKVENQIADNNLEEMLNVINNHEKWKRQQQQSRDKYFSQQRPSRKYEENLSDRFKKVSLSGHKESNQPRRYSSLRQKAVETSAEHRQPVLPPEWVENKSGHSQEFKASLQNEPPAMQFKSDELYPVTRDQTPPLVHGSQHSVSTPSINQYEPEQTQEMPSITNHMTMPANIVGLANHVMSIPKSDVLLSGMDPALSSIQYYESYQQQQRAMMSTLTPPSHLSSMITQQQQQPVLNLHSLEQMHHNNVLMTTSEEHKITSPPRSHISSIPNTGDLAGSLGSLNFPPPLPHNFPPSTYMPRNVLHEPPQLPPLPFPPNHHLLGQQVHGVTYYTQPSPNVPNLGLSPDGSPIRKLNSNAIPIRPPMHL